MPATGVATSETLAPIHLLERRVDPVGLGRGGPSWGMHHLSEYSSFEVVFFFRLFNKHGNINLISAILRSHPLVIEETDYNADRLKPPALLDLGRQLLEEDHRIQVETNSGAASATARLVNFSGLLPDDEKPAGSAFERIWLRWWKRLSDDLVKSVKECDEKANSVRKQIAEVEALEKETSRAAAAISKPPAGFPPRNGVPTPPAHAASKASPQPGASPLAAPVPEAIKKGPSPPQVPAPKKEPTPQPPRVSQPPQHPQPLRPLQPMAAGAKPGEAPRPNGAGQVLQAPPGVSQSLSPVGQPGRPASPAVKAPSDAAARPKQPATTAQQTAAAPSLKWEAPYQGPPQAASPGAAQRPLQPSTAKTAATQSPMAGQASKWPPSPAPSQPATPAQAPATATQQPPQHPAPSPGVLAPPQPAAQQARPQPQAAPAASTGTPAAQAQQQARPSQPTPVAPTPAAQPSLQAPTKPAVKQQQAPAQQQPVPKPTPATAAQAPKTPVPVPVPSAHLSQKPVQTPVRFPPTLQIPSPAQPQARQTKPDVAAKPAAPHPPAQAAPASQPPADQALLRNTAIATLQRRLSGIQSASLSAPQSPQTPQSGTPSFAKTGHSTRWVVDSTPSTPGALDVGASDAPSPAYEQITSPVQKPATLPPSTPQSAARPRSKADTTISKPRGRPGRAAQMARRGTTPSGPTRRSQSVASQVDELSMDHGDLVSKVKDESTTPRIQASEDAGDTTADESLPSRRSVPTSSLSRRSQKRKRQESEPPAGPPTHVQWTRGFPKVSSSALDQIGSHRDANMFAHPIRERDAPNYSGIVLQPTNIMSIKKAITHGNRVATQAATNLPGGDPGTPVVLLPISEDLVPPKGIINSAQLERELVHMFCNAVMYNPDPDRGPGPAFMRGSHEGGEDSLRYEVDEFGVVRNTRKMFVEVEKLLGDLRNAESQRGVPTASLVSMGTPGKAGSVAAEEGADDVDELAQDDAGAGRRKRAKA